MGKGLSYEEFRRRYLKEAAKGNPDLKINEEDVQKAFLGLLVYANYEKEQAKKEWKGRR